MVGFLIVVGIILIEHLILCCCKAGKDMDDEMEREYRDIIDRKETGKMLYFEREEGK